MAWAPIRFATGCQRLQPRAHSLVPAPTTRSCSGEQGNDLPAGARGGVLGRTGGPRRIVWAMALDVFAGIHVGDYEAARPSYQRLLGRSRRSSRTRPRRSGSSPTIATCSSSRTAKRPVEPTSPSSSTTWTRSSQRSPRAGLNPTSVRRTRTVRAKRSIARGTVTRSAWAASRLYRYDRLAAAEPVRRMSKIRKRR